MLRPQRSAIARQQRSPKDNRGKGLTKRITTIRFTGAGCRPRVRMWMKSGPLSMSTIPSPFPVS